MKLDIEGAAWLVARALALVEEDGYVVDVARMAYDGRNAIKINGPGTNGDPQALYVEEQYAGPITRWTVTDRR